MNPRARRHRTGAALVALVGFGVAGPLGAVIGAAVVLTRPLVAERRRRRRAARHVGADVATIFELTARAVRSGVALPEALGATVAAHPGPAAILVTRAFTPGGGAVAGVSGSGAGDDPAVVVDAVAGLVGGAAGGSARGLEAGALILRERERARGEIDAGIAQARTSARLLIAAPVVLAAAATLLVPGGVAALAAHPVAVVAVVAGIGAEVVGAWWTRRLIATVEGATS